VPRRYLIGTDFGGQKITGLGAPTASSDAATKAYVDASGGGGGGGGGSLGVRREFADAAVTLNATDRYVAQVGTMSAPRIVTLPSAASFPVGVPLRIADESGSLTALNTIAVGRAGADLILNGVFTVVATLTRPYEFADLYSDGVDSWVWQDAHAAAVDEAEVLIDAAVAAINPLPVYDEIINGDGIGFYIANDDLTIFNRNAVHTNRLTVDRTLTNNNATTLITMPALNVPVDANTTYWLDAFIIYNVAVVADLKWGWTFPFGTVGKWEASDPIMRGTKTQAETQDILGTGTNVSTRMSGWFRTATASGTFGANACQVTANPSNVMILEGSRVTLTKLGIADGT